MQKQSYEQKQSHDEAKHLCSIVEEATVEALLQWDAWSEMETHSDPDLVWTLTDVPLPIFNNVLNPRIPPDKLEDRVQSLLDRARRRSVPMLWWLGSYPQPPDIADYLLAQGLTTFGSLENMTLDLDNWVTREQSRPGFSFEEVVDETGLRVWAAIAGDSFEMPPWAQDPLVVASASPGLGPDKPLRHFLAIVDGKPAGVASLIQGSRSAAIFNVGVPPDSRGKGIGGEVSRGCLDEAVRSGYSTATLQATPMGKPVYAKLGFRTCGIFKVLIWNPDSTPAD